MKELKNAFSCSLAEELMPDLSCLAPRAEPTKFALFLSTGESVSIYDVEEIKKKTGLTPLFFNLYENSNHKLLRSYARSLNACVVKAESRNKFALKMSDCAFSVSENASGAFLSLLSHTPVYVDAGSSECRSLVANISRFDFSSEIIIPYTKNRTSVIIPKNVKHDDFLYAVKKIRADICADFQKLFMT